MTRECIKQIVESFGHIQFPYKTKIKDWMSDIYIYNFYYYDEHYYIVSIHGMSHNFKLLDEAIDFFLKNAISKDNLALAIQGIKKHQMIPTDKELDDFEDDQLKRMCKTYFDEYFENDYSWAKNI